VNTLPATFSGTEDIPTVLAGILVADPDAGTATLQVKFSVDSGTLTLSTSVSNGVTFGQVSGNGTSSVVITASQQAIDNTLADPAGLTLSPPANANGVVNLPLLTNDQGHPGSAPPLTDMYSPPISISPVDDPPVNTLPATASTPFNTPVVLTGITVADVDAG